MNIVVTTHNPILVSKLWDISKKIKTYYTTRDKEGSTRIAEIDIDMLAKEMRTAEEILFMPPKEVLEKYVVKEAVAE